MAAKGKLQPGADADFVVFDFQALTDRAAFAALNRRPEGVRHLVASSRLLIADGVLDVAARPGRPVRRTAARGLIVPISILCCSLEADLLRTLAAPLRHDPRPEFIAIETSGVTDPSDIVRNLTDPMIWREAPLETVLCVIGAMTPAAAMNDALPRSQRPLAHHDR